MFSLMILTGVPAFALWLGKSLLQPAQDVAPSNAYKVCVTLHHWAMACFYVSIFMTAVGIIGNTFFAGR